MDAVDTNSRSAEALRAAATGSGMLPRDLRTAIIERAGGGTQLPAPYDALVQQVASAAYRVTDAQVAAVRAVAGSDKAAFELVLCASIGAGLARWDAAARAIE
ncbi:MAG: hypothetical protein DI570_29430, partial [Phenylobacterium zucineum]